MPITGATLPLTQKLMWLWRETLLIARSAVGNAAKLNMKRCKVRLSNLRRAIIWISAARACSSSAADIRCRGGRLRGIDISRKTERPLAVDPPFQAFIDEYACPFY